MPPECPVPTKARGGHRLPLELELQLQATKWVQKIIPEASAFNSGAVSLALRKSSFKKSF